ncbi:MAG: adenylate kinase [Armatimonadetes bacterium]|nr:adenylate kinase [Armatimonadota bacterium]
MKIVLLGPPGGGKGTQAAELSRRRGIPAISTGDMFRDHVERGTELGRRVRGFIERGELVPDALVLDMVWDRLAAKDCETGFILDGFPRTVEQAEALDQYLADRGQSLLAVINLEVPAEEIVRRISNRRVCPVCGRSYHMIAMPPAEDERCDVEGAALIHREDDRPEVILRRLEEYHARTEPVVHYYRRAGILRPVCGVASAEQVAAAVLREIEGAAARAVTG